MRLSPVQRVVGEPEDLVRVTGAGEIAELSVVIGMTPEDLTPVTRGTHSSTPPGDGE
jgi:hypothetical protein